MKVSALILTFNEQENIGRTLGALGWAQEVVIIDSGSTDRTLELARTTHSNVRIVPRDFDSHPNQWNFGLDQVATEWVLTLDADYEISPELAAEIQALTPTNQQIGFWAEFEYRIYGHPLRGSSYPPRIVLFKPSQAGYVDDGHTQTLWIRGADGALRAPPKADTLTTETLKSEQHRIGRLTGKIYHDDRKPLSRWIQEQDRYARLEARHLLALDRKQDNRTTRPTREATAWQAGRQDHGIHLRTRLRRDKLRDDRTTGQRDYGTTGPGLSTFNSQLSTLSWQDRLRLKIFFAAPIMFLYLLFVRGLILDGWPGWFYVAQRCIAELLLSMRLLIERQKLKS